MLNIADIRKNKKTIIEKLLVKNFKAESLINSVIEKDDLRKINQKNSDQVLSSSNKIAKEIGLLFKSGELEKANLLKKDTSALKEKSKELITTKNNLEKEIKEILFRFLTFLMILLKRETLNQKMRL